MSVDQTFHTPSFGDEEFDIPPLTLAPTAAASRCSGQGVFGNQVPVEYLKRRLNGGPIYVYLPRRNNFNGCQTYVNHHPSLNQHPSCQQQQQQQQQHLLNQGHLMESAQYRSPPPQQQSRVLSPPQQMYQNTGGEMIAPHSMHMQMQQTFDGRTTYSNAPMHQGTMQPPQMPIMHQQHIGQMGPPQQQPMFSTISQSQMSSQLGLQIGMGPSPHHQGSGSMGSTPPGSNHNSPGLETSEDSDDSTPLAQLIGGMKRPSPEPVDVTTTSKVTKKPKAQKKKKKRDPNEPQKPVSAYALFFRDTQAAIKGQNPNASFGEVSKIVASMWDSLDVEHKNIYKKKTETAKKEYLKALAAYRATLVSKAAVDQSDSMYGANPMNSTSPPVANSPSNSPPGHMLPSMQKKVPVLTSVVDSMQPVTTMANHPHQMVSNQQVWHMQSPQSMMNDSSQPHMMHPNTMVNVHPPQMQPQRSPQPQMANMNRPPAPQISAVPPQLCHSTSNSPTYPQNMSPASAGGTHPNVGSGDMMVPLQTCLRNGCSNPAVDSPDWDREYCSSECVVSHCRDVFTAWVASRQANTIYSTVK